MRTTLLGLVVGAHLATGQIFVGSNSSQVALPISIGVPGGITDDCAQTFNTTVTCDGVLPAIAFTGYFPSTAELVSLCTSACTQSLQSLRSAQLTVCKTQTSTANIQSFLATSNVEHLLWSLNSICRKDKVSGDWCAPVVDNWASNMTSDQNAACSDCVLGSLQLQLQAPYGSSSDLQSKFTALTSSCMATNYAVTSPTPYMASKGARNSTSRDALASCNIPYTIKSGDDCHSISKSERVSTALMLSTNGLEGHCTNFPAAGEQLCLPQRCDVYTVQVNDTCWGITQTLNGAVMISQLVSWNVDINRNCDNLDQLVGDQICISFPGDLATTTAAPSNPTATPVPVPSNVINGTNARCGRYYSITTEDTCASITQRLGISLSDFYFLNPEVNNTSCNDLLLGYSYCVQAVGDIKTYSGHGGILNDACVGRTTAGASSCYATTYSTGTVWQFPTASSTASSSAVHKGSTIYDSVSTPSVFQQSVSQSSTQTAVSIPTQTGMASSCNAFYPVVQGDTCATIVAKHSIQLSDFYKWNPAVGSDCRNLLSGFIVCVGLSTSPPSSMSPSSPASSTSPQISARAVNSVANAAAVIVAGGGAPGDHLSPSEPAAIRAATTASEKSGRNSGGIDATRYRGPRRKVHAHWKRTE